MQGSEVLLPIPAYMEVYVASLEGHALVGGNSAIDLDEEAAGAYANGTGVFDLEARPRRTVGKRVIVRSVGFLGNLGTPSSRFGGLGTHSNTPLM